MNGLNIDDIMEDATKKELLNIVTHQLGSEQIDIFVDHGSEKGDNNFGELFRILYKNANENVEGSLILKMCPGNRDSSQKAQLRRMFLREILMYNEVLPLFNDMQLSKGIIAHGFNECPACYGSISEDSSESIFLEDLTLRKFQLIDVRNEPLTFDHMSLLMKSLGKFHAMSFALRDQHPDKFDKLKRKFPEIYWDLENPNYVELAKEMWCRMPACLEEEKRFDLIDKLNKVIGDDLGEGVKRFITGSSAEPYAVICHGDVTTKNSMFRYDEHGKPAEIQLFDFQCSRYASPVTDLVLYLLCSTTKQLRDKHYEDFLKIYHESLSHLLSRLGSDPQKLFPYEALLQQFREFGLYAGIICSHLLPMLFADRSTMSGPEGFDEYSIQNMFLIPKEFKKDYNRILTDMLDDMVRFGYL